MEIGSNVNGAGNDLWISAMDSGIKNKKKLKKSERIQCPEFELAAELIEDPYWQDILKQCARKKFPRSFCYSDKLLKHKYNNKSIKLPDDPLNFCKMCVDFFKENGRMFSELDKLEYSQNEEEVILVQLMKDSCDWKKISKSKIRRAYYIRNYVDEKYNHIPDEIREELYTQINVCIEDKFIKKEHIDFNNYHILTIDGIDVIDCDIVYTRQLPPKKLSYLYRNEQKDKIYRHYDNWLKYLEDSNKITPIK